MMKSAATFAPFQARMPYLKLGTTNPVQGFPIWANIVWERSKLKINQVKNLERDGKNSIKDKNNNSDVLKIIDEVSEDLCEVLDYSNCCASTCFQSPELRDVARDTFLQLYKKVQTINSDPVLFKILKQSEGIKFERGMLEMIDDERSRVAIKTLQEFEWEGAGVENEKSRQLSDSLQNQIRMKEAQWEEQSFKLNSERPPMEIKVYGFKKDIVQVPNTEQAYQSFLSQEQDSNIRLQLFEQHYRTDSILENFAQGREELRKLRDEAAKSLNFPTFAHFAIHKNMAREPSIVRNFLRNLAKEVKPVVDFQLKQMKIGKEWQLIRKSDSLDERFNKEFTLKSCLTGMSRLFQRLFQVELKFVEEDLIHVVDSNNVTSVLGRLYLDITNRSLNHGAALYQLRTRLKNSPDSISSTALLTYHFSSENGVIGFSGFRTLMHEFGHVLHCILSRTEYQQLSGTRCEMDFMETPSLLFERLAWDERVINFILNLENTTQQSDQFKKYLTEIRCRYAAIGLQNQVIYSLFDLEMFLDLKLNENQLFWNISNEFGSFQIPENYVDIRKEIFFLHSIGAYAGSYYSYAWSDAIAIDIYKNLFEKDPLNQSAGLLFKENLLTKGGARWPEFVLESLLGRKSFNVSPLIQDITI